MVADDDVAVASGSRRRLCWWRGGGAAWWGPPFFPGVLFLFFFEKKVYRVFFGQCSTENTRQTSVCRVSFAECNPLHSANIMYPVVLASMEGAVALLGNTTLGTFDCTFQLIFSVKTMFFSHNKSVGTIFRFVF